MTADDPAQPVAGPPAPPPHVNARRVAADALSPAASAASSPGQYVGQEGFISADGILALADAAGIRHDTRVLDMCCGTGGPGRLMSRMRGCRVHGVDGDPDAVAVARARSHALDLDCTYAVARIPPLPTGPWDVAVLIETLLAFPDKPALLAAVAAVLAPGGRLACTVEAGVPLTAAERAGMPHADTVWPVAEPALRRMLARTGFAVRLVDDVTAAHLAVVHGLVREYVARRPALVAALGVRAVDDLIASHRLWEEWMRSGRIRKLAVVAVHTTSRRRVTVA